MQDEAGFRQLLKRTGKKPHVIDGLIRQVLDFETYLADQNRPGLAGAELADLEAYVSTLAPDEAKKRIRGLILYFRHAQQDALAKRAAALREHGITQKRHVMQLRELLGVDPADVKRLQASGIVSTLELLAAARTPADRRALAKRAGIKPAALLELVKLSDLSRLQGVKAVRTRLYYDAGLDTPAKFAGWTTPALREMLVEFVERTGFDGIASLPKEIEFTIEAAAQLPPLIEY
ncbi:DUF4332 domain-containing protein [bacterium]|nr:DUF4332 domain-containing protein [bacterium]